MSLIISLFLSTFILEDVALASALAFISAGKIGFPEAFFSCMLGISVGDLGLYFFGKFARHIPYFKKKSESPKFKGFLDQLKHSNKMDFAIVISRVIPGTRVPTYFAAGVIKYPLLKFIVITILSVSAWVIAALNFGQALFLFFEDQKLLALISFFILLFIFKKITPFLTDKWSLKAAIQSWRKWIHFEFWPAWFFYLPIVPYYIYFSIRFRSFLLPFYASPHFKHGGLIGESKWDFLKHLDIKMQSTLPAIIVDKALSFPEVLEKIKANHLQIPFIAKPDVGQRGFGVKVIRSEQELESYLGLADGNVIIQKKSEYLCEAGIFYVRKPDSTKGFIFSITDKKFPFVIGDGVTTLGDLILEDKRARVIASTYFKRHKEFLDQILNRNQKYVLSECGNHCQGALFLNGYHLSTPQLLSAIEEIAQRVPDFYFGRIDIRYKSESDLKLGINFEIVEVNGAGSEATHIWDSKTKLLDAYQVLFQQWHLLFSIGSTVKKLGRCQKPKLVKFMIDCAKVYFRKGPLTTSS